LDPLEVAGVLLGVAYVVLAIRESPWCWPFGIGNAALFLVVFAHARIYSNAALQAVYVVVSLYGWYLWLHGGKDHGRLPVSRTPRGWLVSLVAAATIGSVALGLFLRHRTDAALPFPDAATTASSLAAQWMTTRKWLESWLVWIAVDVVYVAMYFSQGLYPTAALYAAFLVLATLGYREWGASMRAAAAPARVAEP
jgi:nicotinamide mononucleotide transporter